MRILQINAVPYGSTGGLMFALAEALEQEGHAVLCTAGFTWKGSQRENFFLTSTLPEKTLHILLAKLTGRMGCFSILATLRLLRKMEEFRPDVVHLHNLHGWFVNLPLLTGYLRRREIPVVWTLHDCWAFTGHCPHFDALGCEKWKTECHSCPQFRAYPGTFFDCSRAMYRAKKRWFSHWPGLTLVTPSAWLKGKVEESFLRGTPVQVIPNGVDGDVFCPVAMPSGEKHRILGVAYHWNEKKGLDAFVRLAVLLGDAYEITLVGEADGQLPPNIRTLGPVESREELAKLYAGADVFVNPTLEDNFPTVNLEALACGTPVITYATGGSPEMLDESCGNVVPKGDVDALAAEIRRVCGERPYTKEDCRRRSREFTPEMMVQKYMELYRGKL